MDAQMLIDQAATAGMPAPQWFVQFFKCLGFTLHVVAMNLWFAGLPIALWLHLRGGVQARRWAGRLLGQMPVIVAVGVNLGIVPLLFVQLAYYKTFYPATILMAWFWLGIVGLLVVAYYGIYIYASGLGPDAKTAPWKTAVGWLAAGCIVCIGFLFANGFSLTEHVARWPALWENHSTAGAALGTALNVGDPTLWARWLLMFGLALGTTAVWPLVDAFWLLRQPDEAYRRWAWGFARKLYTFGMLWAAAAGAWYVFGTWTADLRNGMFEWPWLPLTVATAVAPGLPWLLILFGRAVSARAAVALIVLAQFGVLAINAVSRQVVQNVNLEPYWDVLAQPTDVQWSPLMMFLITFVIGLGIIAWMLAQLRKCPD